MAPLLAHAAKQWNSVLLAADAVPNEDVSKAGNEVVHEDQAHMIMFAGIFFIPILGLILFVGSWAVSRAKAEAKKHSEAAKSASLSSIEEQPVAATETLSQEMEGGGVRALLFTRQNIMVIFVPLGFISHFLHWGATATFILNCCGMLPLAGIMGVATEELALHTGQAVGGLLNATFGNAVEVIFVVQSLRSGLVAVTKGTLLGSILANELLVLGMALFFGGLVGKDGGFVLNKQQVFSKESALIQSQMLLFSSFTICMPSMFEKAYHIEPEHVLRLSRLGSICCMIGYCVFMFFSLYTHADMLRHSEVAEPDDEEEEPSVSVKVAMSLLLAATILVAIASEFLVHSIDGFAHEMGFSQTFIGVVILPIIGNACEHSTAILVALKDKVTLSIGIAIGSTIQVSLFVVPLSVIVGWILDVPMNLDFHRLNSWALLLSSLLVMSVLVVGKSTWMNGFVLLSAYCILSFLYFLSPDDAMGN